ncbi:UDP-GlcNAc:betaGal beta-1,3-N-acetylglucosaminyltransferase [Echinococcus granulosus]|uniref:UDP-GlcNAc:betaGal beta-1,3-N-acetylglucosaminyltransferase n=1 Tax=Echinococcus granulosus TaxID=6210 RepID=W6U096_ECHGR|nr:UDP-GlcNAc:betaGal beta-1,3-N-acetylglucosaminyltransferase [Echinococcus granulosus]EUB54520.1 UDP-GlcNAc:betaGal beta-1,3-N-acetylglucosaminyltransferase [Echinococcus granulosus]
MECVTATTSSGIQGRIYVDEVSDLSHTCGKPAAAKASILEALSFQIPTLGAGGHSTATASHSNKGLGEATMSPKLMAYPSRRIRRLEALARNGVSCGLVAIILFFIIEVQILSSSIDHIPRKQLQLIEEGEVKEYKIGMENTIPSTVCRWPPSEIGNIVVKEVFNITLCVRGSLQPRRRKRTKAYTLNELFGLSKMTGSFAFDEFSLLPRRFWGRMRVPEAYLTYPQDVPMTDVVEGIKRGLPVLEPNIPNAPTPDVLYSSSLQQADVTHVAFQMPDYNFPITILSAPKSACREGEQYDLVVVFKSALLAWNARSSIREYMHYEKSRGSGMKVGVVFSVGLPRKHGGRMFDRDGEVISLPGSAGDLLEMYDGREAEVMARIYKEMQMCDDILLADYEDTYYNLTWKTVTNYRWMSAFCRVEDVKLFMTMDDDHRVNLSMVAAFLNRVPQYTRRNSIFGSVARRDFAHRSPRNKLYLSFREFPWDRMYPYARGFAQLVGPDIVADIAIATAYTRYNYAPEDVYIGMVALKLGIPIYEEATMYDHDLYRRRNRKRRPAMIALAEYFPTT